MGPDQRDLVFASKRDAQRWVSSFVSWYNTEHHHSAIRFVTPNARHTRRERELLDGRARLYAQARAANPTRWSRQTRDWSPIGDVCLNPERDTNADKIRDAA